MTLIIVCAAVVAYLAVVLWSMRWLYGRWRAKEIDRYPRLGAKGFDDNDPGFVMLGAAVTSLFWPVTLPLMAVSIALGAWMNTTPAKSQVELREEHEAMRKRIGELERELKIGDSQ